tara:strand:+ start:8020 stop:9201 length:1182 start_codon:yes stop_codon:yes gene_type:complete
MLWLLVSFSVSLLASWLMITRMPKLSKWMHDQDLDGVQKFHAHPTPRTGGVAVMFGILGAFFVALAVAPALASFLGLLLVSGLPVFAGGLVEDLTKQVKPRYRLLLAFASAALAFLLMDAAVTRLDLPWLDSLLEISAVSLVFTLFAVGATTHAVNIIDGFNGLMLGYAMLALSVLAWVAYQQQDLLILQTCGLVIASIAGLFVFNYPRGRIFAGDAGACFIGFLLCELTVLVVARNPGVSSWFALLVLIYPVTEVAFSVYRRKILRSVAATDPDAKHLHTLIYRRYVRFRCNPRANRCAARLNASTSKYLWVLTLVSLLPAAIFWNDSLSLLLFCSVFVAAYITCYWKIVRFRFYGRSKVRSEPAQVPRAVVDHQRRTSSESVDAKPVSSTT